MRVPNSASIPARWRGFAGSRLYDSSNCSMVSWRFWGCPGSPRAAGPWPAKRAGRAARPRRLPGTRATLMSRLVALILSTLCVPTQASDDCFVADALVNLWIRSARGHSALLPTTAATRRELQFTTQDQVVLDGYSYSALPQEDETPAQPFVLLLQGSASSAAQLAETASSLALAARREVFVYEYRGYARGSAIRPTAASIQADIADIIDHLSEGRRSGVVIGLSLGGVFAIHALKRSRNSQLRALVDSAPARLPAIPFTLGCPRWMDPLDAATAEVIPRLGVLYSTGDAWSKDPAAGELMDRVNAGGGRVWVIDGGHVDLSPSGLAIRIPIYAGFVRESP